MKSALLLIALIATFSANLFANIQAQLSYSIFYSPSLGPYIEVYLFFNGDNLEYKLGNDGYYGEVNVDYEFIQENLSVKTSSFIVQSPFSKDTLGSRPNFLNQHRISLPNGTYEMKVKLRDLNSNNPELETVQTIKVNYGDSLLALSDIEIIQSAEKNTEKGMFQKSGYKIIPYTSEIIPYGMNKLGFYAELYNADKVIGKDSAFLITYYVEEYSTGKLVSNFRGFSRKKANEVNVIIGKFLVGDLPGGNYKVRIDVMNKKNQLLATKSIALHKENPPKSAQELTYSGTFVERYTNIDSLTSHIDYLQPITDRLEWQFAQNQLEGQDMELMKQFFYNFWQKRNPSDPETEWYKYLRQVRIVNDNFTSTIRPGYLSDRGYRYLKYGPPDDRFESFDEPNSYPYEVWYYNQVNQQTNKMIVFYNKTIVLNDYELLHSDILGELYNKDWNLMLHRMNPGFYDDESPGVRDQFGDRTKDHLRR